MITWQMIKKLTEDQKMGESTYFKTTDDYENPIVCFLRPGPESIEFRLLDIWDKNYMTDKIILYTDFHWEEITQEYAHKLLNGNFKLI